MVCLVSGMRLNHTCLQTSPAGHGIGTLFHTAPNVPHYKKNKAVGIMRPGHTFTIEPMINVGARWEVCACITKYECMQRWPLCECGAA